MKRTILTLITITLATASCMFLDFVAAKPAMAQLGTDGARWVYEPNVWSPNGRHKRSGHVYQNRNPQPPTTVTQGAMPHGNALLGVDPNYLSPAPPQPIVRTATKPTLIAPNAVPAIKPAPFNPAFGAPVQPQQPPVLAQQPPNQFGAPNGAQPSGATSQGLHGKMMSPRQPVGRVAHASHLHGRMSAPRTPSAIAAEPKVISYNNSAYKPGSTSPTSYSRGISSSTSVNGVVLGQQHK